MFILVNSGDTANYADDNTPYILYEVENKLETALVKS